MLNQYLILNKMDTTSNLRHEDGTPLSQAEVNEINEINTELMKLGSNGILTKYNLDAELGIIDD
jgi:hypothetical protein